ncbi:hypothetical protein V4B17_03830 [Bartonella sp. B23]
MMIFLLESSFLDKHVNDEKNEFYINEKNSDLEKSLSWANINKNLKSVLNEIIDTNFQEIREIKRNSLKTVVKEYPYLAEFLNGNDMIGGMFQEDQFIEKAEKILKRKIIPQKRVA